MRWLKIAILNAAAVVSLVVVIEGGISLFLFLRDITVMAWEAAPYSDYDPELGWIAKPGVSLPDFWGKGIGIRTNSQRFRNAMDIAPAVAAGKTRVICSGDSFTFGDGVDTTQTWCQQLAQHDSRLEPVNLGQGGYGTDQAYLRFLRDAKPLQHQIHLLAFIDDDFHRMQSDAFLGFSKPVLRLESGSLKVGNVPVPRTSTSHPWLQAVPRAFSETRTAVLVTRIVKKYGRGDSNTAPASADRDAETKAVLRAMFADLKRVNAKKGSTLILVHLPTLNELSGLDPWNAFLRQTAQEQQIPLIDLCGAFQSRTDGRSLFLLQGTAGGHYNAEGHAFVADEIAKYLEATIRAVN
ncbi:MAG TPA: hypothetical protein VLV86_07645 [Vicinamibacterales bacterium]|nr:hypothetical protein [Vicinamibacterales bacterium]